MATMQCLLLADTIMSLIMFPVVMQGVVTLSVCVSVRVCACMGVLRQVARAGAWLHLCRRSLSPLDPSVR